MQVPQNEMQLLAVAGGVILFTIIALIVFILGVNILVFYLFAAIAIGLGLYLSFNLSKEGQAKAPLPGKKTGSSKV